jgi:hypothetical protein
MKSTKVNSTTSQQLVAKATFFWGPALAIFASVFQ